MSGYSVFGGNRAKAKIEKNERSIVIVTSSGYGSLQGYFLASSPRCHPNIYGLGTNKRIVIYSQLPTACVVFPTPLPLFNTPILRSRGRRQQELATQTNASLSRQEPVEV